MRVELDPAKLLGFRLLDEATSASPGLGVKEGVKTGLPAPSGGDGDESSPLLSAKIGSKFGDKTGAPR